MLGAAEGGHRCLSGVAYYLHLHTCLYISIYLSLSLSFSLFYIYIDICNHLTVEHMYDVHEMRVCICRRIRAYTAFVPIAQLQTMIVMEKHKEFQMDSYIETAEKDR